MTPSAQDTGPEPAEETNENRRAGAPVFLVSRALNITDGTVKLHVKSILRKLGIRSRVEAAVLAVEHGLGRRKSGEN